MGGTPKREKSAKPPKPPPITRKDIDEANSLLKAAEAALVAAMAVEPPVGADLQAAIKQADAAGDAAVKVRNHKHPDTASPAEEKLDEVASRARTMLNGINEVIKKKKDEARKVLMQAMQKGSPLTGDPVELDAALQAAVAAGVPEKETGAAASALEKINTFHGSLREASHLMTTAAAGNAIFIDAEKLQSTIEECKVGAVASLGKMITELYLQAIAKPAPLQVSTEAMEEALGEAAKYGVDADFLKPIKKKFEDAKKAQNAKKIADRKAKKEPAPPPKVPPKPEASAAVEALKVELDDALQLAEAKLTEAKAVHHLTGSSKEDLLEAQALNDIDERPVDEVHPTLELLAKSIETAIKSHVDEEVITRTQAALEESTASRIAVRRSTAKARLLHASSVPPGSTDCDKLVVALETARKESVDADFVAECENKLTTSYRVQSEETLRPLAMPDIIHAFGFDVIEPLKKALAEAEKRNGAEDMRIKGQAKLEFWLDARTRRDNAKKELDASLSPPPVLVDTEAVERNLAEATEACNHPDYLKGMSAKQETARLAQRVYERAKLPVAEVDIAALEEELTATGGIALKAEEEKAAEADRLVEHLNTQIDILEETIEAQACRDKMLQSQKKKVSLGRSLSATNGAAESPAWVRASEDGDGGQNGEVRPSIRAESAAAVEQRELNALMGRLEEAGNALKAQQALVASMISEVHVPQDMIKFAQAKLACCKAHAEMVAAARPELLNIHCATLYRAIKAAERDYGRWPVDGLDEQDANVPKALLKKASKTLAAAEKAQARRLRATQQLEVRVAAPTGTSTFDVLVKLVAEGKAAGAPWEVIADAEAKLKKMEDLAASSLKAGPMAFVSYHFPCLRSCVSQYAISLAEKAEADRVAAAKRQADAIENLATAIGEYQRGDFNKPLLEVDLEYMKSVIHAAAVEGLAQEHIELARHKLGQASKYQSDFAAGLIPDEEALAAAAAAEAAAAEAAGAAKAGGKKRNFKNYGYTPGYQIPRAPDDE